jgi:VIT1/CCC1 family predicted Fe2+/Mn2+ transporter
VSRSGRALDPVSRISEILFGLIMALTFTNALSAGSAGHEEVGTLLLGAVACNVAWGLVDAVMFLMSALTERGRSLLLVHAVRRAATASESHGIISAAMPPLLASFLTSDELEKMRLRLVDLRSHPAKRSLTKEDWLGALAVFLLVFLSTFPVVIPFLVITDVRLALRISNLVAIAMLFAAGFWLGRYGGYRPWRTGATFVLLGILLVEITVALGG